MRSYDFKELLKEKLKNPEFRKEWDAQNEEFEVAKKIIRLRIKTEDVERDC